MGPRPETCALVGGAIIIALMSFFSTPGASTPSFAPTSSFSLGNPKQPATATTQPLFGQSTSAPSFGGTANQPAGLFGATGPSPTVGGGALAAPEGPAPPQAGVERSFYELQAALAETRRDGTPNPSARAVAVCYNMMPSGAAPRPAFVRPDLWSAAVAENPDSEKCGPVPVVGFGALARRVEVAREACASNDRLVAEIAQASDLLRHAATVSDAETAELRVRNDRLVLRLLRVAKKLEVLRSAHIPIYPKERGLEASLQDLARSIKHADASLDDLVRKVKHTHASPPTAIPNPTAHLQTALQAQTDGLHRLLDVVQKDERDIELLKTAFESS